MVKNLLANAGRCKKRQIRSLGWEDSLGGGRGKPLKYSSLENPMDRAAWWATVHSITKSQTQLKQLNMHPQPVDTFN